MRPIHWCMYTFVLFFLFTCGASTYVPHAHIDTIQPPVPYRVPESVYSEYNIPYCQKDLFDESCYAYKKSRGKELAWPHVCAEVGTLWTCARSLWICDEQSTLSVKKAYIDMVRSCIERFVESCSVLEHYPIFPQERDVDRTYLYALLSYIHFADASRVYTPELLYKAFDYVLSAQQYNRAHKKQHPIPSYVSNYLQKHEHALRATSYYRDAAYMYEPICVRSIMWDQLQAVDLITSRTGRYILACLHRYLNGQPYKECFVYDMVERRWCGDSTRTTDAPAGIYCSPCEHYYAVTHFYRGATIYSLKDGAEHMSIPSRYYNKQNFTFDNTGTRCAIQTSANTVEIYDIVSKSLCTKLTTPSCIASFAFDHTGTYAAVGLHNGDVRIYTLNGYSYVDIQHVEDQPIYTVHFDPTDTYLACGTEKIHIYTCGDWKLEHTHTAQGFIRCIVFDTTGRYVAVAGTNAIYIYDTVRRIKEASYTHLLDIADVVVHPAGKAFYSVDTHGTVHAYDLTSHAVTKDHIGTTGSEEVQSVHCNDTGTHMIIHTATGASRIYNLATGHLIKQLSAVVQQIQFVPHTAQYAYIGVNPVPRAFWEHVRCEKGFFMNTLPALE